MPDQPLVSIIIPLYNAERYIAATLESAINQSWPNIELIVVDDGSGDASFEIARMYASSTINVVRQTNSGPAAARNHGLRLARGKYIQFLDADDLLSANKIEAQVRRLEQHPECLCFCRTAFFYDGADPIKSMHPADEPFFRDFDDPVEFLITLLGGYPHIGGMVQPNSWLTPRTLIDRAGPWKEALHPNPDDDGEFFFRVILQSRGVLFCEQGLNYYRKFTRRNASYSNPFRNFKALRNLYKTITIKEELLLQANAGERAKKAIAKQYTALMINSFPFDRSISRLCRNRLKAIGPYYYYPVVGGRSLELIKRVFGWKLARYCSFVAGIVRHKLHLIRHNAE